jgi:hypothetical protein
MITLIIKPNAPNTSNPIYTGIGIISKEIICYKKQTETN